MSEESLIMRPTRKPPAETTAEKQRGRPFPPGVSGNPAGRPKGSRHKLEESFVVALVDDFDEHGVEAIRRCRIEQPAVYLSTIVKLLPKENTGEIDVHISHEMALKELE